MKPNVDKIIARLEQEAEELEIEEAKNRPKIHTEGMYFKHLGYGDKFLWPSCTSPDLYQSPSYLESKIYIRDSGSSAAKQEETGKMLYFGQSAVVDLMN